MIITSNIGAKNITEPKHLGFSEKVSAEGEYERMKSQINDALKVEFRPEFLNRLDDIIIFNKLTFEDIKSITALMLKDVKELTDNIGISLDFSGDCIEFLAKKGYDKLYGARPLRRAIMTYVENAISEKILSSEISAGDSVTAYVSNEKIEFKVKSIA